MNSVSFVKCKLHNYSIISFSSSFFEVFHQPHFKRKNTLLIATCCPLANSKERQLQGNSTC